jgi:hypothetical protein
MAAPRPAAGRLPDDPEKAARKARIAANGGMGALGWVSPGLRQV